MDGYSLNKWQILAKLSKKHIYEVESDFIAVLVIPIAKVVVSGEEKSFPQVFL